MTRYKILKQGIKYYVVPDVGINYMTCPSNFLSYFLKSKAERVKGELESAWSDGYMYRALFPPVPLVNTVDLIKEQYNLGYKEGYEQRESEYQSETADTDQYEWERGYNQGYSEGSREKEPLL